MTDTPINSNVMIAFFALIGAVVTGWIAFMSGKNTAIAQLQSSINEGFKALNEANQREINELKGEIRQLKQYNHSLVEVLRANGLDIPSQQEVTVVFAPFPENKDGR